MWPNARFFCRLQSFSTETLRRSYLPGLIAVCLLAAQNACPQQVVTGSLLNASTETQAEPYRLAGSVNAHRFDAIAETSSVEVPGDSLSQPPAEATDTPEPRKGSWFKRPGESEFIIEGLMSYGNYKIFASGYDEKLFTGGVEYDRHCWGYFLKAQVDYVAEFLPFVLLDKPLHTDIWGNPNPKKDRNIRQHVPGVGLSPIGFRMEWRSKKTIKPYLEAKGGLLVFTKKVPSSGATYENFSLQSSGGVQVKMNERWGLRLGLFSDFHFSDAFIVPVNPGLDVMNANLGLSYHF